MVGLAIIGVPIAVVLAWAFDATPGDGRPSLHQASGSGSDGGTNDAHTASFAYSCTGLSCDFDGSGSSDSDGSISRYEWDFGDGSSDSGVTVTHTYGASGGYAVTRTTHPDQSYSDGQSRSRRRQRRQLHRGEQALAAPPLRIAEALTDVPFGIEVDVRRSAPGDRDGSCARLSPPAPGGRGGSPGAPRYRGRATSRPAPSSPHPRPPSRAAGSARGK